MSKLLVILGSTASGKTKLACNFAAENSGEIISADSRQVYEGMTIGTGKDLEEFKVGEVLVPHHLIDIKSPGYKYNISEFQIDFINAFNEVVSRTNLPILCGGSGLYIETALQGNSYLGIPQNDDLRNNLNLLSEEKLKNSYLNIDENILNNLNAKTTARQIRAIEINQFLIDNPNWKPIQLPKIEPVIVGIDIDRELRRKKITDRLSYRLNHGLIEEVERLLASSLTYEDLAYYGLEYKWVGTYLKGEINKKELFEALNIAIHQFSKRQLTWFRRMEKKGYKINWISAKKTTSIQMEEVAYYLKKSY